MAKLLKCTSIHEAGHAVIARVLDGEVSGMGPFICYMRMNSIESSVLAHAAGCIAESVIYKRSLMHGFLFGAGEGDWEQIKINYQNLNRDLNGRERWLMYKKTAKLVRQNIAHIVQLADLHQENFGHLDEDQIENFFAERCL